MIWTSGSDKLCDWFNRAWLEFTGRTMEQELGNGWAKGVHPDDISRCLSIYNTAFDNRKEFIMEYRLRRHDGVYRRILDIGGPYFSSDGEFCGYFGSCTDVTDATTGKDPVQSSQSEPAPLSSQTTLDEASDPSGPEVRAALDRVLASDVFQSSPQLAAFLRFIVEATLRGQSAQLKGYTIAVEALGRDEDFDPQQDPIVRVEAARLRRALQQYYGGPGATDLIAIDLPRGRYIPIFHYRRKVRALPAAPFALERSPVIGTVEGWLTLPRARFVLASLVALALIGGLALLMIGPSQEGTTFRQVATDQQLVGASWAGNGMPTIFVEPFSQLGEDPTSAITPGVLRSKLRDAIVRFDEFNVISEMTASVRQPVTTAEHLPATKYQLGGTVENRSDGETILNFWLLDAFDGAVVWSRTFEVHDLKAPGAQEDAILSDVAVVLAGPSGIIHAHARKKPNIDPRYACLLRAYDYLYGFDPRVHDDVLACLERMTKLDPTFANGFSALSMVYYREHSTEIGVLPGDSPPVDRALKAAQRAVALKPQSARAHEALLLSYFAQGALSEALAEGDIALLLNPLDRSVPALYGMILAASGQLEKGEALLKQVSTGSSLSPTWVSAYLSVVSYLKGDLAAASTYANLDVSDAYPLGIVARALVAAQGRNQDQARRFIDQLVRVSPVFRENPRRGLETFIRSPEILDRLVHDLGALGLGPGTSSAAH